MRTLKVIDLFCGCGGFSLGFDYAGFEIIYALDKWEIACRSYKANFPHVDVHCEDALNVDPKDIPNCDIIIGSPPCQDHSVANHKRTHDTSLINWFWEIVRKKKPKYVIMEETPLARDYLPPDVPKVRIYRMSDFGVPQLRRRLFAGDFPEPKKQPVDVIFPTVLASEYRRGWKTSRGGLSKVFRRRSLIPEAKIVQTFPLDYVVYGTLEEQYAQIGNAVPPLMAYKLAEAIMLVEEGFLEVEWW
ncbi:MULTISPECIES: DNA cytosine methyltransferase [unclassified Archaeoglobus]|uniref:DNA cytosine methyltransferase n=1 Tax=unclassified Archaeoglobus TaxID=2643606 RepID=UPI0025C202AF|nr:MULTISPECIES: DNA cytosine methyltransferase [unclassified Archaeoglobus]